PVAGRSADDPRVVAHGLAVDVAIEPAEARVGEPLDVSATVSGLGNVALWPEPAIHWPTGFRTYPGEATVRVESKGGQIGGSKTFRYLAVPDSAGAFLLPEVRYAYYDVAAGAAAVARAAPRALAVGQGAEPRAARPLPPLDRSPREAWSTALVAALVPWGWVVLLVGPPLVGWFWRRSSRRCSRCWTRSPPAAGAAVGSWPCASGGWSALLLPPSSRRRRRPTLKRSTTSARSAPPPIPSRLVPRPGRASRRTGTTSAPPCIAPVRTARPPRRGRSPRA